MDDQFTLSERSLILQCLFVLLLCGDVPSPASFVVTVVTQIRERIIATEGNTRHIEPTKKVVSTPKMIVLGGFIPRRFSQWAQNPAWSMFAAGWGFLQFEIVWGSQLVNSKSLIPDPHRYVYNPAAAH